MTAILLPDQRHFVNPELPFIHMLDNSLREHFIFFGLISVLSIKSFLCIKDNHLSSDAILVVSSNEKDLNDSANGILWQYLGNFTEGLF